MANELPTLKSTDNELENIYDVHSKRFFHWLETNSISANSSRDIALLAHNELVKRSNDRFSKKSVILTYSVICIQNKDYKNAELHFKNLKPETLEQRIYLYYAAKADYYYVINDIKNALEFIDKALQSVTNNIEKDFLLKKKSDWLKDI